jgi:hypothetical protein
MPWFPNLNHQTTKIENVQKTRNDGTKFSMRNMRNSFMTHEMALITCNTCSLKNEKQIFVRKVLMNCGYNKSVKLSMENPTSHENNFSCFS